MHVHLIRDAIHGTEYLPALRGRCGKVGNVDFRTWRRIQPSQRIGWALVVLGLGLATVARMAEPGAPPLYDGVVVIEPYLWLDAPLDHPEGAEGVIDDVQVGPAGSETVAVSTPELSPQASVFGVRGALKLPKGARQLTVSIQPVRPTVGPPSGYIDGNVYRFEVTDQEGRKVTADPKAQVTVVLRAADQSLVEATIERFDGVAWRPIETNSGGVDAFYAIVTEFGDFAVVAPGTSPYSTPGPSIEATPTPESAPPSAPSPGPTVAPLAPTAGGQIEAVALVAVAVLVAGVIALVAWRRRMRRPPRREGWD